MSAQDSASSARRRWFVAVLLALVILAVIAGIALSRLGHADAGTAPGAASTAKTELGAASSGPTPASAPVSAPVSVVGASTAPTRKAPSTAPATPEPAGPVIVRFHVTTKPSCPSGTDKFRNEGQPVTLEWKVTGAEKTTLAVDGPGIYKEYGPSASETLSFPCGGDPGTYQTHTYTLTAVAPDGTKSKKITVQAKVNEITAT